MINVQQKSLLLILIAGLMSCQNLPKDLPSYDSMLKASTGQDGRACIRNDRINGYGTLDTGVVSVDTFGKKYYLVTTIQNCNSLDVGFKAAFKGSFSEFCSLRDKIITQDEACNVRSIFEFESRNAAFDAFNLVETKRNKMIEDYRQQQE